MHAIPFCEFQRARKKATGFGLTGETRPTSGYVREGGIFGRKKEIDDEDRSKRRERGVCNGNLWIYINGQDFDKPVRPCPPPPRQEELDDDID